MLGNHLEKPLADPPFAATAQRIGTLAGDLEFTVGLPQESGWVRLRDLADPARLAEWESDLEERLGDRRAARFFVANDVACSAARIWALPVMAEARLPLAGLEDTAVFRSAEHRLTGIAASGDSMAVLAGDPAAPMPGVTALADRDHMFELLADRLAAIEAIFAALRSIGHIGLPAIWGGLADNIGSNALRLARLTGRRREDAWAEAGEIIEKLAARQPKLRQRPRPYPVSYSKGQELFMVRATCCLYYRTVAEADPDGDGYCGTCPLRTDSSRTRRVRAYLDKEFG